MWQGSNHIGVKAVSHGISDNINMLFFGIFSPAKKIMYWQLTPTPCHIFYVKNHMDENQIHIPSNHVQICWIFTEGMTGIYQNLSCPSIHVNINSYAHASLVDIIHNEFYELKNLPVPCLLFITPLHGLTPCGQDLLSDITQNPSWTIQNLLRQCSCVQVNAWTCKHRSIVFIFVPNLV